MPVKIDGKTFDDHDAAVAHIKRTKPSIADPDAYVATVERAEKGARIASLLIAVKEPSVTIPHPYDPTKEHNVSLTDLAHFHIQRRGFPSILNLGKVSGEGQSGGRAITEAAHDAENKFVEKMGNDGYIKAMSKKVGDIDKRRILGAKKEDDRIDPKTGKPKASFTLLEKGEYGIGKKYKGAGEYGLKCTVCGKNLKTYDQSVLNRHAMKEHSMIGSENKYKGASHPFNKMAALYKLQILSRVKGAQYVPHDSDPLYENLDVESRQGIDNLFNKEKVGILYTKLGKLEFTGSASATPKKTGADVEKEKEKIPKGTTNPFDFLGAKIREAVMSDFEYKETSVKQTGWGGKVNNPGPVSVKEPKKDPEEFGGGLSAKSTTCPTCGYYPVRDQKLHDKIIHSDN